MSVGFVWNDSYSVGHPDIDGQHKRLFELENGLPESPGDSQLKRAVLDLYKHTREQFKAEEALMRQIGYPKSEDHRGMHGGLIVRLNELSARPFDDDSSVLEFKKFVYSWIIDHNLTHDRDVFRFAQERRAGP